MEQLFTQLEKKLSVNREFMNDQTMILIDKLQDQDELLQKLCEFTEIISRYDQEKNKKDEMINEQNDQATNDCQTLLEFINSDLRGEEYSKTLEELQQKFNILADDVQPHMGQQEHMPRNQDEELKVPDQSGFGQQYQEQDLLKEEEKELLDTYGPRIKTVSWYFENDNEVKVQQVLIQEKRKNKGSFRQYIDPNEDDLIQEQIKEFEDKQLEKVEFFNGLGYEKIQEEIFPSLEQAYQDYLSTKKKQELYVSISDDIYIIQFDSTMNGHWFVQNTVTKQKRHLIRKEVIKGPFIESKIFKWAIVENEQEELSRDVQAQLTGFYEQCQKKKKNIAKYLTVYNKQHIFCIEFQLLDHPYLINLENMGKLLLKKEEIVSKWDYIATFKPPQQLSIESGNIFQIEPVLQGTPDFEYVSNEFIRTFNKNHSQLQPQQYQQINPNPMISKAQRKYQNLQNNVGNNNSYMPQNQMMMGGGARRQFNQLPDQQQSGKVQIKKIEKIYNCVLYEKFMNEFKRMLRKYPGKQISDILKHLFHGSSGTDPQMIYATEDGLDVRFSNPGVFGNGIYFADNSAYSHQYAFAPQLNEYQMFMCMVLVGDSVTLHSGQYRLPPNKPNSVTERYDSINNGPNGHFIIYDNVKCYPGYLVTYTC